MHARCRIERWTTSLEWFHGVRFTCCAAKGARLSDPSSCILQYQTDWLVCRVIEDGVSVEVLMIHIGAPFYELSYHLNVAVTTGWHTRMGTPFKRAPTRSRATRNLPSMIGVHPKSLHDSREGLGL